MKIFKISKKALYIFYEIKIHQLCQLLSKIELIKYLFFSVKIQVFRVKNFDMLKNVTLKKQTNNRKLVCVKNQELWKTPVWTLLKIVNY